MTRFGNAQSRGGVWAGVEARDGHVHIVIARAERPWEVVEARSLPTADVSGVAALLTQRGVTRVVRVAPAGEVVCRVAPVPPGEPAQVVSALSLLAEAELPEAIPAHRRASGVIEKTPRADGLAGLLTGWMPGSIPDRLLEDVEECWVAPAAVLGELRDGGRYAVWADRASRAIVAVFAGEKRAVCRTLVETRESDGAWKAALSRAIAETAAASGLDPEIAHTTGEGVTLDAAAAAELRTSVTGAGRDPGWLDTYGLALGAILVAGSDDPAVASLAALSPEPRVLVRSPVVRLVEGLTDARLAARVLVAAIAATLLVPLGVAYAKLGVLSARVDRIIGPQGKSEQIVQRSKLYEELDKQRLPMTKLLADVAGAAPVGVSADNVRVSKEQGLSVLGVAESADKLNQFQANLNKTGIFARATVNRSEATADGGVSFDLSALIDQPGRTAKPAEDLGGKTLAEVLYGEGASNSAYTGPAEGDGSRRGGGRRAENGARSSAGSAAPGEASRRPSTTPAEAPPPLTDEQIAKMPKGEATLAWVARRSYINKTPTLDATSKGRMEDEIRKLQARAKEAQ